MLVDTMRFYEIKEQKTDDLWRFNDFFYHKNILYETKTESIDYLALYIWRLQFKHLPEEKKGLELHKSTRTFVILIGTSSENLHHFEETVGWKCP